MIQHQCPRFHLYNAPAGDDQGCPVCAAQDAELSKTRGVWQAAGAQTGTGTEVDADLTQDPVRPADVATTPPTIGVYDHLGTQIEPVVGWLACIDGPDKGRDWRLVSGRNLIGRGEAMPVRLATDHSVSRERHAVVSFDPRRGSFSLAPGDGRGLVYCNGQEVLMPRPLAAFDRIEVGSSMLLFVPLVGERFTWNPGAA